MADCDNLEGGIELGCDNNFGGLFEKAWITEKVNITSIALASPSGKIGTITMAGSPPAEFFPFEFNKNTSNYVENETTTLEAGRDMTEQLVTLIFNRREKTKRDILLLLAKRKNLVVIVKDNNGLFWLFGEEHGVNRTTTTGGSGTQKTDPNQYVVTLRGEEPEPANEVEESCMQALGLVD